MVVLTSHGPTQFSVILLAGECDFFWDLYFAEGKDYGGLFSLIIKLNTLFP